MSVARGSGDLSSHFNLLPWHMARDEYGRLQRTRVQTPAKWTPTENSTMQPKENTILVRDGKAYENSTGTNSRQKIAQY